MCKNFLQVNLSIFQGPQYIFLLQLLKHKVSLLEASNMELQRELQERQTSCDHLTQRAIDAQVYHQISALKSIDLVLHNKENYSHYHLY